MTYKEAVSYLKSLSCLGSKPGLTCISKLLSLLQNPQEDLGFIHVAGTNGKGSICAMVSSVLIAAGYKTGLFLSPYVSEQREGILINGVMIEKDKFGEIIGKIKLKAESPAMGIYKPTEFEILTAAAFLFFNEEKCDAVVLEAGLGGLLDATNVINAPLVSVIASISKDHTGCLGNTIEEIARHKCGIIKKGGITVCYPCQQESVYEIINNYAAINGNLLKTPDMRELKTLKSGINGTDMEYRGMRVYLPLAGEHQVLNCITAIETVRALNESSGYKVSESQIKEGVESSSIQARQEVLCKNPLVILDGAHNYEGVKTLERSIKRFLKGKKITAVMGILKDKEYKECIEVIARLSDVFIAAPPKNPRALESGVVAETARKYCSIVRAYDDIGEAAKSAVENTEGGGAIVICGSLYLTGPIREIFINLCTGN